MTHKPADYWLPQCCGASARKMPPYWSQVLGLHCRICPRWIAELGTIDGSEDFIVFLDPADDAAPEHWRAITAAHKLAGWSWEPAGLPGSPSPYIRFWKPLQKHRHDITSILICEGETSALVAAYIEDQAGGGEWGGRHIKITPATDCARFQDRGGGGEPHEQQGYAAVYATQGATFPTHDQLAAQAAAAGLPITLLPDQDKAGEDWTKAATEWATRAGADWRVKKLPPADLRQWWRAARQPSAPHARHRLLNDWIITARSGT